MFQLTPRKKSLSYRHPSSDLYRLICRILGFFYRIYLSRTIGAEGLGLYQMVHPLFGICFALCAVPSDRTKPICGCPSISGQKGSYGYPVRISKPFCPLSLAHHFLSHSPGPICAFRAPMCPISSCYRSVRSFLRPSRLY